MQADGRRITIEEWAGDNGLTLSSEQIEELVEALQISDDMSQPCGYGVDRLRTKENVEIKLLKEQIDRLERFIQSKGYWIVLHNDRIEECRERQCGSSLWSSDWREFR